MDTKPSLGIKLGYGITDMGIFAVEILIRLHLLKFYTDVVGLTPELAGLASAAAIFWDAITDPLMGALSDRAKFASGKRRPFILLGGFLLSISIVFLYNPPILNTDWGKFVYLVLSYMGLNTCMTIIAVPYSAFAGEITEDRYERTKLFGYRLFFGNIGLLVGTILPGALLSIYANSSNQALNAYSTTSVFVGLMIFLVSLITFFSTKNSDTISEITDAFNIKDFILSFGSVLKNPIFLPLFIAYLVSYIGVTINSTLALYYYEYRLGLKEADINLILGIFIVVWSLSIVFWILMSKKFGKKYPAFIGVLTLGILTCFTYPFFPKNQFLFPLLMAIIGGVLVGSIVLFDALLADIVDYDELKTKLHREGLYFGFWKMGIKFSRSVSLLLTGLLLSWTGFVPNREQSMEVSNRIAWLFGPGVGMCFVVGALLSLFMPLTDSLHTKIQRILTKRKKRIV
ncbi:MAG: MFS transporter [Leptospiraceae bacterium]|nr:MFS transporter [Leptospiraceae bacterium]MCP5495060.1 MFS transporter [Leptospiraceae bacterium]